MTIIQSEGTNGLNPVKTWHMGLDTQVPMFYKLPVIVQSIIGACIVLAV